MGAQVAGVMSMLRSLSHLGYNRGGRKIAKPVTSHGVGLGKPVDLRIVYERVRYGTYKEENRVRSRVTCTSG